MVEEEVAILQQEVCMLPPGGSPKEGPVPQKLVPRSSGCFCIPGPTIHKVRHFASSEHTLLLVLMDTCNDISSFHVQILKSIVIEKLQVENPSTI